MAHTYLRKSRLTEAPTTPQRKLVDVTWPNGTKETMCSDCFTTLMSPKYNDINRGLRSQTSTSTATACPSCRTKVAPTSALREREMTGGEKQERERILHGMKGKKSDFQRRYGADADSIMYATATKQAMGEPDTMNEAGYQLDTLHQLTVKVNPVLVVSGRTKALKPNGVYLLKSASAHEGRPTYQFYNSRSQAVARHTGAMIQAWIDQGMLMVVKKQPMTYPMLPTEAVSDPELKESLSRMSKFRSMFMEAAESEPVDNSDVDTTPVVQQVMVPLRYQAATLAATALGGAHVSGKINDFRLSSGSPDQIVDYGLRAYLKSPHSPESWAMAGRMLKMLRQMGIQWDDTEIRPAQRSLLGLEDTAAAAPDAETPTA